MKNKKTPKKESEIRAYTLDLLSELTGKNKDEIVAVFKHDLSNYDDFFSTISPQDRYIVVYEGQDETEKEVESENRLIKARVMSDMRFQELLQDNDPVAIECYFQKNPVLKTENFLFSFDETAAYGRFSEKFMEYLAMSKVCFEKPDCRELGVLYLFKAQRVFFLLSQLMEFGKIKDFISIDITYNDIYNMCKDLNYQWEDINEEIKKYISEIKKAFIPQEN